MESKLNLHQLLKDARKAGTARTDQDQTFKKPFQTVRRPPTTNHNIHDDFVRNPPKNVAEDEDLPRPSLRWAVQGEHNVLSGALDQEGLGRIKFSDMESELVQENSIHS